MRRILWLVAGAAFLAFSYFAVRFPDHEMGKPFAVVGIIMIASPSILAAVRWLGGARGLGLLLTLSALAYAIETFGLLTGWPYGHFAYGDGIGPKIGGLMPVLLPFAFVPLVLGAIAISEKMHSTRRAAWLATGVAALVALDVLLDPGAVAMGYWSYSDGGIFHGVPLSNFGGWVLSGSVALATARYWIGARDTVPAPSLLGLSAYVSVAYWTGVALWLALWAPCLIGALLLVMLFPRSDSGHSLREVRAP